MSKKPKTAHLYHEMTPEENFEICAQGLFNMVLTTQRLAPGASRVLFLSVRGHRNPAGGFDNDAYEIMTQFSLGFLLQFLTEAVTPYVHVRNPRVQKNELLPLIINPSEDSFDHETLSLPPATHEVSSRKSPPPVSAIARHLGLETPACVVCWSSGVERAHVIPKALGGTYDVENFVLLCKEHHEQAPDIADPDSFWAWISLASYRVDETSVDYHSAHPGDDQDHFARVKDELVDLYGWDEREFASPRWEMLMREYYRVIERSTTTHFGVSRKASTDAWAFEIARRRLRPSN